MRSQNRQIKSKNKLYLCRLCSFTTTSYEELDLHYKMSHEFDDDISYEFEFIVSKKQKKKTFKEKVIEQLKLLIFGKQIHEEYIGWCTIPYFLRTRKVGNRYIISLESGVWDC